MNENKVAFGLKMSTMHSMKLKMVQLHSVKPIRLPGAVELTFDPRGI